MTVSIVPSQYNSEFTDALVENAREELAELTTNTNIELIRVPGAFEIPVTIEALIRKSQPKCIIALGLMMRGQTAHGDLVADSVTQALQNIAVQHVAVDVTCRHIHLS